MCGRYLLQVPQAELQSIFEAESAEELPPARSEVRPTDRAPVLVLENARRKLRIMRWGIVPPWAGGSSGKKSPPLINARSETILEKATFRDAFLLRRCIVLATRFLEWKTEGRAKSPYSIGWRDDPALALAGIWEPAPPSPEAPAASPTFTILTTSPNPLVAEIHDRMPVLLARADWNAWLDPATPAERLRELLQPALPDLMTANPLIPEKPVTPQLSLF